MTKVKCKSGITGTRMKLHESYKDFDEFQLYSELYNLAERLGYSSAQQAWDANPTVESSVNPSDFRKVKFKRKPNFRYYADHINMNVIQANLRTNKSLRFRRHSKTATTSVWTPKDWQDFCVSDKENVWRISRTEFRRFRKTGSLYS